MSTLLAFLITSIVLVLIILGATFFINPPTNDYEKHSAYECGFEPFGDSRSFFDVHFYTIGLLFLIFDLEIVFLIPAVVDIASLSAFGFMNIIIFLVVVLVGFYYEWAIGLLNWLPAKASVKKSSDILYIAPLFALNFDLVTSVNISFFAIWMILILSLFGGSFLTNLIHKVLNLAALSILVVAIFSIVVDFTFMNLVYILAFLGAVVMLFISVILMLPASVTSKLPQILQPSSIIYAIFLITDSSFLNLGAFGSISMSTVSFLINIILLLSILVALWIISERFEFAFLVRYYKYYSKLLCGWYDRIKKLLYDINKVSDERRFYRKVLSFHGFTLPIPVIRGSLSRDDTREQTLHKYRLLLTWHDFLYFVYANIEAPLYKKGGFYDAPIFGKFFDIFTEKTQIAKEATHYFVPQYDAPSLYVPYQTSWSLFKLMPAILPIRGEQYSTNNSFYSVWVNRFVFVINFIIFFVTNGIPALYKALKVWFKKTSECAKIYFGFSTPYSVVRTWGGKPKAREHFIKTYPFYVIWQDFLFFIYTHIERPLYRDFNNMEYVWGFIFAHFELIVSPARQCYVANASIPTFNFRANVPMKFEPIRSKYSLFDYLPVTWHCTPGQYLMGESSTTLWINRLIFVKCFITFFIVNILSAVLHAAHTKFIAIKTVTLIKQFILMLSIFLIMVPHGKTHTSEWTNFVSQVKPNAESLSAMKQILYEYSPLFALVAVVGLLVALVGAAIMSRKSKKK